MYFFLFQHSICEVRAFFQLPTGTIDVRTAAMETIQEVAKISQAGLIYAIDKHKVNGRHANISGNLLSPENVKEHVSVVWWKNSFNRNIYKSRILVILEKKVENVMKKIVCSFKKKVFLLFCSPHLTHILHNIVNTLQEIITIVKSFDCNRMILFWILFCNC